MMPPKVLKAIAQMVVAMETLGVGWRDYLAAFEDETRDAFFRDASGGIAPAAIKTITGVVGIDEVEALLREHMGRAGLTELFKELTCKGSCRPDPNGVVN